MMPDLCFWQTTACKAMTFSCSGKSNLLFMSFRWRSLSHLYWFSSVLYCMTDIFTALVHFFCYKFTNFFGARMTAFVPFKFCSIKWQKSNYSRYMIVMLFCMFVFFISIMLGLYFSLGVVRLMYIIYVLLV